MNKKITYFQEGNYQIPNLILPEGDPKYENKPIGKYGQLRLNYLKENNKYLYRKLLIENKLKKHLVDTNEEAKCRIDLIINQIALKENINENLKSSNFLEWVSAMNNAKSRAEEIVFSELIYI